MLTGSLILLPLAGAVGAKAIGKTHKRARGVFVRAVCFIEFLMALYLFVGVLNGKSEAFTLSNVCGKGVSFRADGFRSMYALVASFMWLMTAFMSERYFAHYHNRSRYYFFNLLTLTGVMGLFLSDDLYTGFIFFEIMSMASYPWVAHDETEDALRAAGTYLAVAVIGGMVTLMGMFMMDMKIGSLSYDAIRAARGTVDLGCAPVLVLVGFMAKAGAFPVHIWLPKAHPVAPAPASALLSGMLTKAGMFGILLISTGVYAGSRVFGEALLCVALVTMLLGAVMALFSNNLKRTLACSSMSQIGYILTGVAASVLLGEEGSLPAAGAVSHMVNHSVLKLTLFMAAGAVYMNLHRLDLNDIRGFGRNKYLLHAVFLLGALGLMGVPGFNGYVSKTMIHEGLVEWILESGNPIPFRIAEWVFLFAAGLTTGYMLKLYIAVFWQKNADPETQERYDGMRKGYLGFRSGMALAVSACLIPVFGCLPNRTLFRLAGISLPFLGLEAPEEIAFFSFENLKGGMITLVIGVIAYLFAVRKWMFSREKGYINRWPAWLDLENAVYRPLLENLIPGLAGVACAVLDHLTDTFASLFVPALGAVASVLDRTTDAAAKLIVGVLTFASRAADEITDFAAVTVREIFFIDRKAERRPAPEKRYVHAVRSALNKTHLFLARVFPKIRFDTREVTDLRYGSYYTNSVSFGLILCTLGIVFALLFVLLPSVA